MVVHNRALSDMRRRQSMQGGDTLCGLGERLFYTFPSSSLVAHRPIASSSSSLSSAQTSGYFWPTVLCPGMVYMVPICTCPAIVGAERHLQLPGCPRLDLATMLTFPLPTSFPALMLPDKFLSFVWSNVVSRQQAMEGSLRPRL